MLFWVVVSNEGEAAIFYGTEGEAREAAGQALYGPFSLRRGAKGCVMNLQSTDSNVLKEAEKVRVPLKSAEPKTAVEAEAPKPQPAKAKAKSK